MLTPLPDTATCLTCGYALRGLPERVCPECGRSFDPGDPRSFRAGAKAPWWHKAARAPSGWMWKPLIGITLVVIVLASSPGFPESGLTCAFLVLGGIAVPIYLLVVGGDYVTRLSAIRIARGKGIVPPAGQSRKRTTWLIAPVCIMLLASAVITRWPLRARFHLSRPAFDRAAKACVAGTATDKGPRIIGLYYVRRIEAYAPSDIFFEVDDTVIDSIGFMYSPNRSYSFRRFMDLGPPWYIYET